MVKVIQLIVADHLARKVSFGKGNPKKYIVVHQTGNTNKGADAKAHANLQYRGNSREAAWHETVDDKGVYQSFSHDWKLFHAGDGRYGKGNAQGIAIELCVNGDGDYNKMIENALARIKELMAMYHIPIERVISHYDCSKKWCPSELLNGKNGMTFKNFKNVLTEKNIPINKKGSSTSFVGKRVESIHPGKLRFYNKPSWKDQAVYGYLLNGHGFNEILAKVDVEGYPQYKVSNGKAIYYVTASPKYVKVE